MCHEIEHVKIRILFSIPPMNLNTREPCPSVAPRLDAYSGYLGTKRRVCAWRQRCNGVPIEKTEPCRTSSLCSAAAT